MQAKDGETLDMFSLSDLLGAMNVDLPESKTPFQVSDEGRLGPFLDRLAEDMRDNAQAALAGDRVFYRELQRYRNSQAQAYMRDMNLRRVRARAEEAWRAHDFDKVVNLYSPVEDELTTSERAKLAYARQQRPKT
jgi:hypothetical protein